MNIILIGYRGSGKTSIGRLLAAKLRLEFIDTDQMIAQQAGKSIREIFQQEGEVGFRNRETTAVVEAAGHDQHVIAVGGGAVLRNENVAALKKSGKLIYLKADAKTLHQRIHQDSATALNRPPLTPLGGTLEEIESLLAIRRPLYESAADITVDAGAMTVEQAVYFLSQMV